MRKLAVLCALVLAMMLVACPSRKKHAAPAMPRWQVTTIDVVDRTAPSERVNGLDAEVLRNWIKARIATVPEAQLDESGAAGAYRLRLELGVGQRTGEDGNPSGRVVVAALRGTVAGASEGASEGAELQASTVKPLPAGGKDEVHAVRRVVEGLVDDVAFQGRLAVAPAQLFVEALSETKDSARLAAAVEIAGVRKLKPTVPSLIRLLQHKDEQISDRAIGALVAIGDRAAVKPFTRLAGFQDTARLAKVLDAIGSLGGQEAKDYLEFVSTGHEDADIRNLASEALERMNRR